MEIENDEYFGSVVVEDKRFYVPYVLNGLPHSIVTILNLKTNEVEYIDLAEGNPNARGYKGCVYDGRYIYFAPYYNGTTYHSIVARINISNYEVTYIDLAENNALAKGYMGVITDTINTYFIPGINGTMSIFNKVTEEVTHVDFTTGNSEARGYNGAVFDNIGKLYLTPYATGKHYHSLVAILDTKTLEMDFIDLSPTDEIARLTVGLYSSGYSDLDYRSTRKGITVDGTYVGGGRRGMTVGILSYDNSLIELASFDTYGSEDESDNMISFIEDNPGVTLVFVTADEWISRLTQRAKDKLVTLGASREILDSAESRSSYILVSTQGRLIYEDYGPRGAPTGIGYEFSDNMTAKGYRGSHYDGRYVYMAPISHGQLGRIDTITHETKLISIKYGDYGYKDIVEYKKHIYLVPLREEHTLPVINLKTLEITYKHLTDDDRRLKKLTSHLVRNSFLNDNVLLEKEIEIVTEPPLGGYKDDLSFISLASGNRYGRGYHNYVLHKHKIYFAPYTTDARYAMMAILDTRDNTTEYIDVSAFSSENRWLYYGIISTGKYVWLLSTHDSKMLKIDIRDHSIVEIDLNPHNDNNKVKGYHSAMYDGRKYIYLVSLYYNTLCRYDTHDGDIDFIDVYSAGSSSRGSLSSLFIDKNLYLMPYTARKITIHNIESNSTRYIDIPYVDDIYVRYYHHLYDGSRYIYILPYYKHSELLIFDTWNETFDRLQIGNETTPNGFADAVMDGKYIYFIGYSIAIIAVLDTTNNIVEHINIKDKNVAASGFKGIVKEDENIYVLPYYRNIVALLN